MYSRPPPWSDLVYAVKSGGSWAFQTVDIDSIHPSIALNTTDSPRIAYYRFTDGTVRYAFPQGAVFGNETVEVIIGTGPGGTSLVLDKTGQPHLSYWNNTASSPNRIRYAVREPSGWIFETVADFAFVNPYETPSLALDSTESPHIAAHTGVAPASLLYFSRVGASWVSQAVETWSSLCCEKPSLRLDSLDRPHIAYHNVTGRTLRYAHFDSVFGTWIKENVYAQSNDLYTVAIQSLALDRNDLPRISYFDTYAGQLRYFYFDGFSWLADPPETSAITGSFNSLALDPLAAPHVLYTWFDGMNFWIKHGWQVWPDTVPPSSRVLPISPYWDNVSPVPVNATATDAGTGVANVTLWYRHSRDNTTWAGWTSFGTATTPPWSWSFPFPSGEGHYAFYTTAVDKSGNVEPPPLVADAIVGYDVTPPVSSASAILPYWHASSPLLVNATATDNLGGVANVSLWYAYAPDNATWGPWASFGSLTTPPWSWSFPFLNGEGNYRFYTIARDIGGNLERSKTGAEALAGYRLPPDYVPAFPSPVGPVTVGLFLSVIFSVSVRNIGGVANATATLAFYNASTPAAPFAAFPVPPVPPGNVSAPFSATWASPISLGTYAVAADVNHGKALAESNYSDNVNMWTVRVVPGPVTNLAVGAPNVTAVLTYVTSATPLSFTILDQSGTGIRNTTYRVDGGPWVNATATGPFTLAGEGGHLVEWRSEDFAGNVEPTANATLLVDDTPPTTTPAVGLPRYVAADTFVTSATRIKLAVTDGGVTSVGVASTAYAIDGGAWTPYASPFTLAGEGRHTVAVRSTDLLGNPEAAHTLALVVDNTPPTTALSVGTPKSLVGGTFVTAATPLEPAAVDGGVVPVGVAGTSVRMWDRTWSSWTAYASPLALSGADGVRYVEFRSADRLGNPEAARNVTLVLDDTPPTTTLSPASGPYATATAFTLSATDEGSGVTLTEYRIDGGAWTPYTGAFALATGDHAVSRRSVDRLGNQEPGHTQAIYVEGPPPPATADNWKPLVAAVFAAVLALVGAWSARRVPWPTGRRRRLRAFALASLPFVAVEAATGVVSFLTGLLAIPPVLGAGTAVDVGILVAGIAFLVHRASGHRPREKGVAKAEDAR